MLSNREKKTYKLFQFKGFDMEKYISAYKKELSPKPVEFLSIVGGGKVLYSKAKKGVQDKERIKEKCQYLQDVIIRRAFSKEESRTFSLSSKFLENVIGKEYKQLIRAFCALGYIELGDGDSGNGKHWYYNVGAYSTIYTLKGNVEISECTKISSNVRKYIDKTKEKLEEYKQEVYRELNNKYGLSFTKWYNKSLSYIKVNNEDGFKNCIKRLKQDKPDSKYYYSYLVKELYNKEKNIQTVVNGRIYHVLTNCKKEIREYLNIDFSLDCANSQPLLFNYIIFYNHGIKPDISYNICSIFKSINIQYHNVRKSLRKILSDNEIEKQEFAKLSNDELWYICLTCQGKLWDLLSEELNIPRDILKVEMFKQVFYSNTPYARQFKELAIKFKKTFPTVYKQIGEWKKSSKNVSIKKYINEHNLYSKKKTAYLAIAMQALEADIFSEILKRIYKKRWHAFNLHDCIIIPLDGCKNHATLIDVRTIMNKVFMEYGLAPTFKE